MRCALHPVLGRWVLRQSAVRSLLGAILLTASSLVGGAAAQAPQVDEEHIKAAYLYNFAKFVEWPADNSSSPDRPTLICALGDDRLAEVLQQVVLGKQANGRRVEARRISNFQEGKSCQILLIGFRDQEHVVQALRGLEAASVLTVGEIDRFTDLGGMINLVRTERAMELEINPKAAEAAGLKISSRLLAVARIVADARGGRQP